MKTGTYNIFLVLTLAQSSLTLGTYVPQLYVVPDPVIQVFSPRGFQVSVPHEDGVTLFAFHGNINKPMEDLEAGQFSKDILKRRGDRWVFEDHRTKLVEGDVIYFWLFVIKNNLGYRYDDGEYTVEDIIPKPHPQQQEAHRPTSSGHRKATPRPQQQEEIHPSSGERVNDGEGRTTVRMPCNIERNLTKIVNDLTEQVKTLEEVTTILANLIGKDVASSKSLKFGGVLPPYDDAQYTAQVIIREKIGLSIPVVNASWNDDKTVITFHVASLDDKVYLIKTAKEKLKNSKIALIY